MKFKTILTLLYSLAFFYASAQPELMLNNGHNSYVNRATFSHDGNLLASANSNVVVVWDISLAKVVKKLMIGENSINSIAFSANNKQLLVGYGEGPNVQESQLRLWDIETGKVVKEFFGHRNGVNSVCFGANDLQAISGGRDSTIRIWDIKTGSVLKTFKNRARISDIAYSQSKSIVVGACWDKSVAVWNVNDGNIIKQFDVETMPWYIAINKNADIIAIGSIYPITYSLSTGSKMKIFDAKMTGVIEYMAFVDNKNVLICGDSQGRVLFLNVDTGKLMDYFLGNHYWIKDIEDRAKRNILIRCSNAQSFYNFNKKNPSMFSAEEYEKFYKKLKVKENGSVEAVYFSLNDNKLITFAFSNSNKQDIIFWNITNREPIESLSFQSVNTSKIVFSEHSSYYARANNTKISIYSGNTQRLLYQFEGHNQTIKELIFSKDEQLLYSGGDDGVIRVWDVQSGTLLKSFTEHKNGVRNINISPDGRFFISSDKGNNVYIWNTSTLDVITSLKLEEIDKSLAISPDNKSLAVAQYCAKINSSGQVFESDISCHFIDVYSINGEHIAKMDLSTESISSVVFSDDGRYLYSGSYDKRIRIWETNKFTCIDSINGAKVCSINKDYILGLGGGNNSTLKIWDLKSGKEIHKFIGHNSSVSSAEFSQDGSKILSSDYDGALKLWDVNTEKNLLTTYYYANTNDFVSVTPSGYFDGSKIGMQNLHYVNGMNVIPLESSFEKFYTPNLYSQIINNLAIDKAGFTISQLTLPPKIKIVLPENNSISTTKEIQIKVLATDQGGGVDNIQLYVNNKLVETTQRGFKNTTKTNETISKYFTISLTNGENVIRATAFNNQRTESIPHEIKVNYAGAEKTANLYMLIVGINKYKNPKYSLNYATPDASSFKKAIETNCNEIFESVNVTYLSDTEVTKERMNTEFQKINAKAHQEDVFIFYYAGHGVMSEEEKSQFYILPYDVTQMYGNNDMLKAKGISANELQEFSRVLKAQKQLFVLDACQSGGMTELLASRGAAEEKAIAQLARSTGTYWLTASGSEQFATEFVTLGHGVFTYAILQGLKGEADGGSKDQKITVKEISSFLNDKVPELSEKHKGQAQYPTSYGYGQDFPIVIIKN